MARNEYRVARSTTSDKTFNTLDLSRQPTFAVLELLDKSDSEFTRNFLIERRWLEVTPEAAKKRKTYYDTKPPDEELDEYATVDPDWFYLSGHYAPTYFTLPGETLFLLPSTFFNEPFHRHQWEWHWRSAELDDKQRRKLGRLLPENAFFLQADSLTDASRYRAYTAGRIRANAEKELKAAKTDKDRESWTFEVGNSDPFVAKCERAWREPTVDLELEENWKVPGSRGLLFGPVWPNVKVLLLIACNCLTYRKDVFRMAFPSALVLGYIGKNPANAVPHVRQFLENVFRGIRDPGDPRLMDHEHVASAWMDVYRKRGLGRGERMAYMLPDGRVFGSGPRKMVIPVGTSMQSIMHGSKRGTYLVSDDAMGVKFEPTETWTPES